MKSKELVKVISKSSVIVMYEVGVAAIHLVKEEIYSKIDTAVTIITAVNNIRKKINNVMLETA